MVAWNEAILLSKGLGFFIADPLSLEGRKSYNLALLHLDIMTAKERTMPVCLNPDQLGIIEEYAKQKGMVNASQAIEKLAEGQE